MLKLNITNPDGSNYDATELVQTVTWSGDYQQCSRTLEFGLLSSSTDTNIPVVSCPLGSGVILMDDNNELFNGYIFSRQKNTSSSVIDITCFDRGIYLKRNQAVYKFTNIMPEEIAERICIDFGIEIGSIASTGVSVTRNFIGVPLYSIIQTAYTLAADTTKESYLTRFDGVKMSVVKRALTDETVILEGGSNLMSASTTESIENMINQIVVYDSSNKLVDTQKKDDLIKLYGLLQSYYKKSDGENTSEKLQKMFEDNGISQKITVENLGNLACITGNSLVIREPYTGLSGLFWIDSDTHIWKGGQYYNKLVVNFKKIMDEQEAGSEES